ncbi:C-type lectin [Elysia marginata]|uniref:C-type lectin n=1 Tax=Elysia marginata TaxID=1093978 RepID=A0AAV4IAL3_9GAST|nr:C-type lectin [Elysia marginata]
MNFTFTLKALFVVVSLRLPGLFYSAVAIETSSCIHLPQFDDVLQKTYVMVDLHPVPSLAACAVQCASQLECGSFYFVQVEDQKLCQTHSLLFTSLEGAVVTPGARYYQLCEDWCPHKDGYILNRKFSLCYRHVTSELTWGSALLSCKNEGGHLLWLKSQEMADHIKHFLHSSSERRGRHVSIGTHMTNGQDWTFTDGTKVTFTDWADGEPSSWSENCVVMAWFYSFRWNDAPCSGYHWPSLCQIDRET